MVEATFVQLLFWFCPLPQTTIKSGKCGSWLPSVTQFGAVQLLCNRSWREGGGEGGQDIILYSTGCGGRGKYEFVWFLHFLIKISIFKFFAFLATKNIPMDSRDTRADMHRVHDQPWSQGRRYYIKHINFSQMQIFKSKNSSLKMARKSRHFISNLIACFLRMGCVAGT